MNIELQSQISLNIVNHFQWFKVHWNQHQEIYPKHSMIFEIERVEILLGFEVNGATVVIWMFCLETDLPYALQ